MIYTFIEAAMLATLTASNAQHNADKGVWSKFEWDKFAEKEKALSTDLALGCRQCFSEICNLPQFLVLTL